MCNVGFFDRFVRVFVGSLLFFTGVFSGCLVLLIIGAVPLVTGLLAICPVYSLTGANTGCKPTDG
ncbi:MAG: DUF2892 domain-containing protein [Sulfurimonadaceae bacterium]|nr:DUF2892 domain-containing protein [Sulfurimonadaceae bacterium]